MKQLKNVDGGVFGFTVYSYMYIPLCEALHCRGIACTKNLSTNSF